MPCNSVRFTPAGPQRQRWVVGMQLGRQPEVSAAAVSVRAGGIRDTLVCATVQVRHRMFGNRDAELFAEWEPAIGHPPLDKAAGWRVPTNFGYVRFVRGDRPLTIEDVMPAAEILLPYPVKQFRHRRRADILTGGRPGVNRAEHAVVPGLGVTQCQKNLCVRPQVGEAPPFPRAGPIDARAELRQQLLPIRRTSSVVRRPNLG